MKDYKPFKEGKVREIYDVDDGLIIVATDRISAFDVILKDTIPNKGKILTKMSEFWFDFTKDLLPNHMITTDVKQMPEYFQNEKFEGRSMYCKKLTMLPIECIVRGYITGSGWKSYLETQEVCGYKLPEGLEECAQLEEPLFTPSTKAELGDHDENISFEKTIPLIEKEFPGRGEEIAETIKNKSLEIYKKCAEYALEKGIIIADTKFEFGVDEEGNVVLGDEILTPDSSRFWPKDLYQVGQSQPSFDKQGVRDYLKAHPEGMEKLPQEVIDETAKQYANAYKLLTGKEL